MWRYVEALIVEGFMASLKVAVTMVFVNASLAPVGARESTVGGS